MGNKHSWEQSAVVADLRSLKENTMAMHIYIGNPDRSLEDDITILRWIEYSKDKSASLHFRLRREIPALKRRIEEKRELVKLNKSP